MTRKNFIARGLELLNGMIYADHDNSYVGINTNTPTVTLDVNGNIKSNNINVGGITTTSNIQINGAVSFGSSVGISSQIPVNTGAGVTWVLPNFTPRTSIVYTAGVGQSDFSVTYKVGLVDSYVNGIRLAPSQFNATSGTNVVLNDPTFGGETVEFVVYNPLF